ncbi:hypothetical protein D9758_002241 [Tetrapyrgos nigripes]|uniref:NADP-dependent oxidoreductase domain-containing protein n=1 Tax=Tetrapyrgos nigripes TaxID=182062 RepID=A0A8H5GPV2_9AGAR|nr:hypothetical protein D9758_002241 [Tetrapyrgos nigripes]
MSSIVLKRTGQKMPVVGFGLWKVTKSSCADTVYNAIKTGYRLLDGAGDYGNEKEAGEGVHRAIKDGLVKREELFITSKLWNTFHAKEHVKQMAKMQLDLWGLDYFDLYLIHFPVSLQYVEPKDKYPPEWWGLDGGVHLQNTPMQETWTCMEQLVDEGLAKNIGISNCQGSLICDIMRYARIAPQVLQVEIHPYLTQEPLLNFCKTLGMAVTAYSSLGPQSYVELGMDRGVVNLLKHDLIAKVAQDKGKSPAQVLLRWATQQGLAVIPKSNNQHRLLENLECSAFDLSEQEMKQLSGLNIGLRMNDPAEIDPRMAIFA